MSDFLVIVSDYYADPRTKNYPLLGSPIPVLLILALYWLFIKKIGIQFMKNRPPYKLTTIIQCYNLLQVAISAFLFVTAVYCLVNLENLWCLHFDSYGPYEAKMLFISWIYYIDKYLDLLDTVFFVLRKRLSLITPLHTYHHTMMVTTGWFFGKYFPVGEIYMVGVLNTLVHTFMYYYYFIKISRKDQVNTVNDLWWKKYITQLQLVQFSLLLVWYCVKLPMDCSYPKILLLFGILQVLIMLYMFGGYYYRAFIRKNPKENKSK